MQKSYSPVTTGLLCFLLAASAGAVNIKGTITDAAGRAPLPSMVAAAYTPSGSLVVTTTSDSNGKYVLSLPSGAYRILAYDPNGVYATEFGAGADSFETSPIINATADVTAVNFALQKAGIVSGTVTSAAVPLSNITVAAYNVTSGTRRGFAVTGRDGFYSLVLPPGDYRIAAYDNSGMYAVSFFPNQPSFTAATTVTLTSGRQVTGVDFSLALSAHLSGTVVDAETNAPLPASAVLAYTADGTTLVAATATDVNGNFTLTVPPGAYKVVAADVTRIYATAFVADANSFASEQPISVGAGGSVGAIRIPMHRAGAVTGRVTNPAGTPLQGITVAAYNDDGSQRIVAQTNVDGVYLLLLPAGTYRIAAYDPGLVYATQFYPQRNLFSTATAVPVVAMLATPAIDFVLVRGANFTGTITDQTSSAPIAGVTVGAYDDAGNLVSTATSDRSGNYTIVVPAGHYRLIAFDGLLRYVTGYGGGARNYETAAVFQAEGSGTHRVDFTLIRGVHISGTVIDSNAAFVPVSGVEIAALDVSGDRVATATARDGRFDLVLAPGNYKLLAVDPLGRFYAMFYNNAWTLDTAGTIAVQENGATAPISLALIRITRRHPAHH